jgi:hypothetical protein
MILVKDVEDRATLVEREAQERLSRAEVESTVVLASAHEEPEGHVQKVALLEGELAEARRVQEVAKENYHGLSDVVADDNRRR